MSGRMDGAPDDWDGYCYRCRCGRSYHMTEGGCDCHLRPCFECGAEHSTLDDDAIEDGGRHYCGDCRAACSLCGAVASPGDVRIDCGDLYCATCAGSGHA